MDELRINFEDGHAVVTPLSFKETLAFKKLQSLLASDIEDSPEMVDIVKLFRSHISVFRKDGREAILNRISVDAFRALALSVLSLSIPDQKEVITIVCDGERDNLEKQMKRDELLLVRDKEERETIEKEIEKMPDKVPCGAVFNYEIPYMDIIGKIKYLFPYQDSCNFSSFPDIHRQTVADVTALEKITRNPCLEDNLVFVSDEVDIETLVDLKGYLKQQNGYNLDCERLKEDKVSILFEPLYLATFLAKRSTVKSLITTYDKIMNYTGSDLQDIDFCIVNNLKVKDTDVKITCPSCGKDHIRTISLSSFKLSPD